MAKRKHKCEYCGYVGEDVKKSEDPYNSEINNDDTLHWLCPRCIEESAAEI